MISIIVPVYNVERFLPTTVQSILLQEGNVDYEVILVDDGSTDKSAGLCDEFVTKHRQFSVIHKTNGGLSSARNVGLEIAQGDYVLFLDGDDCLDPCTMSTLSKAVLEHPKCDIIQFQYEEVAASAPWGHKVNGKLENYHECNNVHDFFLQLYKMGGVAASACTKLFKRSSLGNLRFKENLIHEDEEFATRVLAKCHCIGYCSNEFYKYVMRDGSIIHTTFKVKKLYDLAAIYEERMETLNKLQYRDLANITASRYFSVLVRLYEHANNAKEKEACVFIKKKIKYLLNNFDMHFSAINKIIACLSRLGIPGMDIYYGLKSIWKKNKIRNAITKIRNKWQCYRERRKLKCTDFSIISNNCWGGLIYQQFGLQYTSPTIGLFFMDEDYLKFVEKLDFYLVQPLQFINPRTSKHYNYLYREHDKEITYPVARLADIEIFFMHYHSKEEAEKKWKYRTERLNRHRLLVKFSQRQSNTVDILERFASLPLKNKLCFTPLQYESSQCNIVHIEALKQLNIQGGDETSLTLESIDIYKVLNNLAEE